MVYTAAELALKSNPELVAIFNALPGVVQTNRFASRSAGIARILRLQSTTLVEEAQVAPVEVKVEAPKLTLVKGAAEEIKKVADKVAKKIVSNLAKKAPKVEGAPVEPKAGSMRARCLDLIRTGTTLEAIMGTIGWNEPQASEAVRILRRMGWAIQNVEGKITLAS